MALVTPSPPRSRLRRRLLRLALVLFGGWLLVVVAAKLLESRLVFRPCTAEESWHPATFENVEDAWIPTNSGDTLHGWWLPADASKTAILLLHGNGGNLSHRGPFANDLRTRLGQSVLLIDYFGYGKCKGCEVSEGACYYAAEEALWWLGRSQGFTPDRVVVIGESLGGGVAVDLASRRPCHALVLLKTFTSIPDVASDRYPFLPAHALMTNRFESAAKLPNVRCPVFIAHGTADRTVPYSHCEKLFELAHEPKQLFRMDGLGHNEPVPAEFFDLLRTFLNRPRQ